MGEVCLVAKTVALILQSVKSQKFKVSCLPPLFFPNSKIATIFFSVKPLLYSWSSYTVVIQTELNIDNKT